jgi:acetyltransferase-like isoleucine patch superfamily enzyme
MDTNFHQMIDTTTERYKVTQPVVIGSYNYIGNRVSVMPGSQTPNCTVASNSLCNKDFSKLEENILLAGMLVKLIRNMISRDWKEEREALEDYLTIR